MKHSGRAARVYGRCGHPWFKTTWRLKRPMGVIGHAGVAMLFTSGVKRRRSACGWRDEGTRDAAAMAKMINGVRIFPKGSPTAACDAAAWRD